MKFKSDIETQAGLIDSFGFTGTAGQVLSSTGTKTEWITPPQTPGGGGSSQVFYFNGGTASSVGGYYQMSPVANTGTGADFTINANGYIASFLTDVNSPNQLNIPAGNWNFEIYFSASSGGGSPSFYVELYKYSSSTFTLIASSSATPEGITNGTAIDLYITALAVPTTTLLATDRLAVRVYVTHSGRTIKMHTQNGHLSEVITTFSTGLTALNGLTEQVQYFSTGTAGTDFNIASAVNTHTFNLPTASATNRGALSSADWITFNSKANASGTTNYVSKFTGATTLGNSLLFDNGTNVGIGTTTPSAKLDVSGSAYIAGAITLPQNPTGTTYGNGVSASPPYMINQGAGDNDAIRFYSESAATNQVSMVFEINDDIETAGNEWIWRNKKTYGGYEATTPMLLSGAGAATFLSSVTAGAFLTNGASGAAGQEAIRINNDNGYIGFFNSANNTRSGYIQGNTTDLTITTSPSTPLIFGTANAEKMRIASGGNVGIGTSSPDYPLEIENTNQTSIVYQRTGVSAKKWGFISDNGATYWSNISDNILSITLTNGGNVGIGTTTPSTKLEVVGNFKSSLSGYEFQVYPAFDTNVVGCGASSNHNLAIVTNAIERMRIDTSGNVGIGTTSPTAKLVVSNGGIAIQGDSNPPSSGYGLEIFNSSTTSYIGSYNRTTSAYRNAFLFANDTIFENGGSERVRISSNGNVGIGTSNPLDKLDVLGNQFLGDGANTTQLHLRGVVNVSYAWNIKNLYTGFQVKSTSPGSGDGFNIDFSNRVGIGTTSPSEMLEVQNGGSGAKIKVSNSAGGYASLECSSNATSVAQLNFTNQLSLIGGNVGIGTTSPGSKLTVVGEITSNYGSNQGRLNLGDIAIQEGSFTSYGILDYTLHNGGGYSQIMRIQGNGNVGIGNTNPGAKLDVSGNIFCRPGAGIYSNVYAPYTGNMTIELGGSGNNLIVSNGNVGIGTTIPTNKLDVVGGLAHFQQNASAGSAFRWGTLGTAVSPDTMLCMNQLFNGSGWTILNSSYGTTYLNLGSAVGSPDIAFGTGGANTAATEKMRITNNGNVGIGTSSPSSNLTVVRNANNASYITTFSNTNAGASAATISEWKVNGYSSFVIGKSNSDGRVEIAQIGNNNIDFINNGTNVMSIDTNQNVMVNGTTAEACAQLEIKSETKGFLPPRMSDADRDNISSPVEGLMIYNTTQKTINFYDGTTWQRVAVV